MASKWEKIKPRKSIHWKEVRPKARNNTGWSCRWALSLNQQQPYFQILTMCKKWKGTEITPKKKMDMCKNDNKDTEKPEF